MSASAAVRGLFRIPRVAPPFRRIKTGEEAAPQCGWNTRVEDIRNVLRQSGHTITQLSAETHRRYGNKSPYFIPPTFLYKLRSGITPHVCQIVALSESTGYRFVDWMRVCGFDLHQIPRLQMRLHTERTVLITPLGSEPYFFPPHSLSGHETVWGPSTCAGAGRRCVGGRYLFAKIGSRDALAQPELRPGSVVRVDRCYARRIAGVDHSSLSSLLWLIEQPGGLICSRIRWIDDQQIVLLPSRAPWGSWPLRLATEAWILGLVDMGLHSLKQVRLSPRATPIRLEPPPSPPWSQGMMRFSDLLRVSRGRTGLTFRAAHKLTGAIAQILGDREYAIALGLLSDYETMTSLPRHIAKLISLCGTYCIDIRQLMESAGVNLDDSAKMPLPLGDRFRQFRPDVLDDVEPRRVIGMGASYNQLARGQAERNFPI